MLRFGVRGPVGALVAATCRSRLAKTAHNQRQFGVKPPGWEAVLPGHPTLGDVDSAEALAEYQAAKREHKRQVREQRERKDRA